MSFDILGYTHITIAFTLMFVERLFTYSECVTVSIGFQKILRDKNIGTMNEEKPQTRSPKFTHCDMWVTLPFRSLPTVSCI